jgi:glycosyltransferase involved in cell wall biosynthesis
MDDSDPIFAHQAEAVESLSSIFEEITVLTGKVGRFKRKLNVRVISTEWVPGHSVRNVFRFYSKVMPFLFRRDTQIFSHMTEVQSALIAPLTKFLRIRHYLWYAHASNSIFLKWCYVWVSGIITSTSGSCPINGFRVFPIGQGVDSTKFLPLRQLSDINKISFLHFGRFDPSKNIQEILDTCASLRENGREIRFTQIGGPSTQLYENKAAQVRAKFSDCDWATFLPSILRENIPDEMKKHRALIHAYQGSLDKTLIESTLLAVPVITVNPEYIRIFGSWSRKENPSLLEECQFFLDDNIIHISQEVERRREIAEKNHSLDNWTEAVANFFK